VKIAHTCLNVADIDRSINFYTKQMGLNLVSRREIKQNNAEIAFLTDEAGGALELTRWRDKKSLIEGDNFDHIAFEVNNIDDTVAQLRQHEVPIAMEPFSLQGSPSRIAFIKDPDGNWLELIERTHSPG
jgi:lactoylglutathione lyase